jgi:aldose 1-epimerase
MAPKSLFAPLSAALLLCSASLTHAADAQRSVFGHLADGSGVEAVTLTNGHGVKARIIAWGAALQSLVVPDKAGKLADIVLSYPDMTGYQQKPQYFGATVGRFANRLGGAGFMLDGQRYRTLANDGANTLHGGPEGFDKRLWTIVRTTKGASASVTLAYVSPDGEQGFPGTVHVEITYALDEQSRLVLTYAATTDKPTVVNLSNHSLFNMAGAASGQSVMDQVLTLAADAYTPVDAHLIPTGEIRKVEGTAFDFRKPRRIGKSVRDASDAQIVIGHGYDHNWVLSAGQTPKPHFAARLTDPKSGRSLTLWTTEPGVQFYSGNFLDGTALGVGGVLYRQGDGVALEPQHFPDGPNQPSFPSSRLDPGQTYRQVSIYGLK